MDLNIKIKNGKFHFGLFDKQDLFLFSIFGMPNTSSIALQSIIVYSAISGESLRTARASNNLESLSTAIKPLIVHMSRHGVSIGKINSSVLKFFSKQHSDLDVCQSKQELLNIISYVVNTYFFIHSGQPITVAIAAHIRC